MSTLFLILLFAFITILVVIMYLFLKKIVEKVNQQSKDYFIDKLKAYDNLIVEREEKLKKIDELIENKNKELQNESTPLTNGKPVYLYESRNISYIDEDIFEKMKQINNKFSFNHKNLLEIFIKKYYTNNNEDTYKKYKRVKDTLTKELVYKLLTQKESVQKEKLKEILGELAFVLDDFLKLNKRFNLKKFISYFNELVSKYDPYIYVYVGNKRENFDGMNKNIKTVYDDSIYEGIKIIYKSKLYDYSL